MQKKNYNSYIYTHWVNQINFFYLFFQERHQLEKELQNGFFLKASIRKRVAKWLNYVCIIFLFYIILVYINNFDLNLDTFKYFMYQ